MNPQNLIPPSISNSKMILVQEEPRGASMLIEVSCNQNALSELPIQLIQQLQTDPKQIIVVQGLRLVPVGELTVAPTSGFAMAPITELQKMTLMLYSNGWQKGYKIPLLALNNTFIEGSGLPWRNRTTRLADWEDVDWNKSSIFFNNGTSSLGQPYTVCFEVEYIRFGMNGKEIKGSTA